MLKYIVAAALVFSSVSGEGKRKHVTIVFWSWVTILQRRCRENIGKDAASCPISAVSKRSISYRFPVYVQYRLLAVGAAA
jgi:hypothetical protein